MAFDQEPERDPHDQCRHEIHRLTERAERSEAEVEAWKLASGLNDGAGDPDGVTPEAARRYWEGVEEELAKWHLKAGGRGEEVTRLRVMLRDLKLDRHDFEQARCDALVLARRKERVEAANTDLNRRFKLALGLAERVRALKPGTARPYDLVRADLLQALWWALVGPKPEPEEGIDLEAVPAVEIEINLGGES